MELLAPAHLGVSAAHTARAPVQQPPDTSRIDATETSGKANADTRDLSQNADKSAAARVAQEKKQAQAKEDDRPAGPPPSFDISLLEVEQDLKKVMARMEISRGQERDSDAVKPDADNTSATKEVQAKEAHADDIRETAQNIATDSPVSRGSTGIALNA